MIEITNKNRSPIPVMVKSRKAPRQFTILNIPGLGKGNNVRYIRDEFITDNILNFEKQGLITTRHIPQK